MRILRSLLLVSMLWCGKTDASSPDAATDSHEILENLTTWNVTIVSQLELTRFIENVTIYTDRRGVRNRAKSRTRLCNLCNFIKITPGLHRDYTRFAQGLHIFVIQELAVIFCNICNSRIVIHIY